jgi:cytoplasmic iron level regulating protein YaaA (DUF328/UPF0246 family)
MLLWRVFGGGLLDGKETRRVCQDIGMVSTLFGIVHGKDKMEPYLDIK